MEIIRPGTRFDFVGKRKPFLLISLILCLTSAGLLATVGLNFGVDFSGGSEVLVKFNGAVDVAAVRETAGNLGFEEPDVQTFGAADEYQFLIRVPRASTLNQEKVDRVEVALGKGVDKIKKFRWSASGGDVLYVRFDEGRVDDAKLTDTLKSFEDELGLWSITVSDSQDKPEYTLRLQEIQSRLHDVFVGTFGEKFSKRVDGRNVGGVQQVQSVGPRVGKQLRDNGVVAIILALVLILIYIAFRFDLRYAPGAVLALFHDVLITLGVYSALQIEVSLPIIAALLTIIGYSLNDTIVIFDRIRENFSNISGTPVEEIVNISVNECLSRTLLTSITTLIAVTALYFFGGGLIQNFAFALMVGVVVGTYSSTFIASPILIWMHHFLESRKQTKASREHQSTGKA
jgi:preprotein translocase subunit SecF